MITKKYYEQTKDQLRDREDPSEKRLVEEQRCLVCGLSQIYAGKINLKNGKGFAICCNPDCDAVEEVGIDRQHEYCQSCKRLSLVAGVLTIHEKERITLNCGHALGWAGMPILSKQG